MGKHGGGSLTGDSEGKMNDQHWAEEGYGDRCLSLCRGPVGEPGEGFCLQGTTGDSGRRAPEMEHLTVWALSGEPAGGGSFAGDHEGYERKTLEMGISFHRSPAGEPGRELIYQGL